MKTNQQAIDRCLRKIQSKAKSLPREDSIEKKMQVLSVLTAELIEATIALRNQQATLGL
jgi:hypothetical protein